MHLRDVLLSTQTLYTNASMSSSNALVTFTGVQKTYDGHTLVVRDLNLQIQKGEFLSLLGPSGSGKTTTLMMLAGFESPTSGEIALDGVPITRTPPHKPIRPRCPGASSSAWPWRAPWSSTRSWC